ncbi:MAG TPA: DUF5652 family protein [Candidatus Paceibacterota bacterium]
MNPLFGNIPAWIVLAVLWTLPWKGVAMWKAARLSHKKWFIILFLANTLGILEIFYIFFIAKKYTVETEEK